MLRKMSLLALGLAMLAGCAGAPAAPAEPTASAYTDELLGAIFEPPRALADFSAASTTGRNFRLSDHQGEVILLYFGYRSCPDFCPTTFLELSRVYADLDEPADKLKIVFVTIDPERDTLENLTLYAQAFHEDFIGLRAEGAALEDIEAQFGVIAEKRIVGDSAMSYLFDHTASIFLIGPNGELEAQYLFGTDYLDIVHDVRLILATLS